jgi:lipoprotein NlpI
MKKVLLCIAVATILVFAGCSANTQTGSELPSKSAVTTEPGVEPQQESNVIDEPQTVDASNFTTDEGVDLDAYAKALG